MTAMALSVVAGYGVFLVYTSLLGWRGFAMMGRNPETARRPLSEQTADWLSQAGVVGVTPVEFASVELAVLALGTVVGWVVFAAPLPALAIGSFAVCAPVAAYRARRRRLREAAREAWPRLLEELRVQTTSVGRSIPAALLDIGRRSPTEPMRAAFDDAHREWLLTTDFEQTLQVLKDRLAEPAADATCETLLVANEIGGADLDHRLRALIADRTMDIEERRDAHSRQAGVRFARWFTLVMPVGMALVGLSIGDGRRAYGTTGGQIGVVVAIALTAGCWMWAGAIMRLPEQDRVLTS